MSKKNKLFQKEFSLKFPRSAIGRKTIVLLTGFILLLTCTITGCGSSNQQQSISRENPAQEEPAQEAQSQSVPEQPDMEQPSQEEANQSQFSPILQPDPEKMESEAETAAPSPDVSSSSPSYFGTWQITSSTFGAYSAMSEEDCSALVGTRFEYFKDYAIYDDQHRLDSPKYFESTLTADDFSSIYQGTTLETLGIFKDSKLATTTSSGGLLLALKRAVCVRA